MNGVRFIMTIQSIVDKVEGDLSWPWPEYKN